MATAEELLLGASTVVDKTFHIDMDTRTILIPNSVTQLGVESDDDVKTITFKMPRYYYGCDLSEFNIYINYLNAKKEGDLFEVLGNNLVIGDEDLTFNWVVGRNAVAYKGTAIFNVCMKKIQRDADGNAVTDGEGNVIVDQEFNTTIAKLPVLEGLETGEEIVEQYSDILMQWEEALFGIENSAKSNITQKGSEVVESVNMAGEEQRSQIALKGSEVLSAVANVKNEVTAEGEAQRTLIVQKGSEVVQTINTRKTEIEELATTITTEGESQKTAIIQKGSEVVGAVNTAGEEQRAAIMQKGSEVINTVGEQLDIKIPEYIEANPNRFKGEKGDTPTLTESKDGKVTTVTVVDGNGTHTFEINDGADGKDGTSVTILGSYSTESELLAAHPTGNAGDGYLVNGYLYVWNVGTSAWLNVGKIQGPAGKDGVSPVLSESKNGKVNTITVTDVNGTRTFTVTDGEDGADAVSPTIGVSKTGKVTTITITDVEGTRTVNINDGVDGTGAGDMLMATYDTDGNGVVDSAEDSNKLGGVAANQYALKTDIPNKAADSDKLGGVAASAYALKTDIPKVPDKAADSDKLGGVAANQYALKTDIPEVPDKAADSDKLGGVAANQYALKTDIPETPTYTMTATDDGNGNVTLSIGG